MTFNHKSTFLRSIILENPMALGDLFGPEDVLRIEREFPELFEPVLKSLEKNETSSHPKSKVGQNPPSSSVKGRNVGNVKSTSAIENKNITTKKPTTTNTVTPRTNKTRPVPSERFSQHALKSSQCNRERCKVKPQDINNLKSVSTSSFLKPNVQPTVSSSTFKHTTSSADRLLYNRNNSANNKNKRYNYEEDRLDNFSFEYEDEVRSRRINPENVRVARVVTAAATRNKGPSSRSRLSEKPFEKISPPIKLPNVSISAPRRRPISSPAKTTSVAFTTPPSTPRFKSVSERHNIHASKSIGFLKPAPILVKRRKNQTPNKMKTPSPSVKFVDKGGDFTINRDQSSHGHGQQHHEKWQWQRETQSCTAIGLQNLNSLTLPALKTLVEQRFGHYIKNNNNNNGPQNQQQSREKNGVEQEQHGVDLRNSNNNNQYGRDLNMSELSDILEGIETENTTSFSSAVTLTSLNGDGENDQDDDDDDDDDNFEFEEICSASIPPDNNCNFNSSDIMPRHAINIKSVSQQKTHSQREKEEQEEYLTAASVDRCEQFLLAKLLASKYEKEGKFKKGDTPRSSRSHKPSPSPPPPLHSQLLETFEKYNKAFELAIKDNPGLLEKIAYELIHAEVKKIMKEEVREANKYSKTNIINEKSKKLDSSTHIKKDGQSVDLNGGPSRSRSRIKTKSSLLEEEMDRFAFRNKPQYKDASVNVNVVGDDKLDEEVPFEIPTPELTPPMTMTDRGKYLNHMTIASQNNVRNLSSRRSKSKSKSKSKSNSSSCSSTSTVIKTPTLSKLESLVQKIQQLELQPQKLIKQKQMLDMTDCDCSELEDFVASEPLKEDYHHHDVIHETIEECITNIPTPDLTSTPTVSGSLGKAGEIVKQDKIITPDSKIKTASTPNQTAGSSPQDKHEKEGEKKDSPATTTVVKPNPVPEPPESKERPQNQNVKNEVNEQDDLFYDYTKEKELLEEIISQGLSQSDDESHRRRNDRVMQIAENVKNFPLDFEASEFSDSSFTSILELISDGELILNMNEEKSPGEVSVSGGTYPYYNVSPGIQHRRVECTTATTTSDCSTFNVAVDIDSNSNLSQSQTSTYIE